MASSGSVSHATARRAARSAARCASLSVPAQRVHEREQHGSLRRRPAARGRQAARCSGCAEVAVTPNWRSALPGRSARGAVAGAEARARPRQAPTSPVPTLPGAAGHAALSGSKCPTRPGMMLLTCRAADLQARILGVRGAPSCRGCVQGRAPARNRAPAAACPKV
jgi:hypothetical protein